MAEEMRVLLTEEDADPERVAAITRMLRSDLLELDVDDVSALRGGEAPTSSRGWDAATIGGLLVTLGSTGPGLVTIVDAVRAWLGRGQGAPRTVRLEIGGDVLELSQATQADQNRLVELFLSRHPG